MITPQQLGPSITPQTLNSAGRGGQQNPPYLQMKNQIPGASPTMAQSSPVITPGPSAMGDTVKRPMPTPGMPSITPQGPMGNPAAATPQPPAPMPQVPKAPNMPEAGPAPQITPASAPPQTPPQAGGDKLGDVYNFFKSDLQNQTHQAKANAITDASARGVYYGTPLTGSETDIDTQYLRGLGQLQSGMYGNAQQDSLARLGLASNLGYQGLAQQPNAPGAMDWSALGNLFGPSPTNPNGPARKGPVITPQQPNQSDAAHNIQESVFGR